MDLFITRKIKCTSCGHEGKVKSYDTTGVVPESHIFKLLGKDREGYTWWKCPSCEHHIKRFSLKFIYPFWKWLGVLLVILCICYFVL